MRRPVSLVALMLFLAAPLPSLAQQGDLRVNGLIARLQEGDPVVGLNIANRTVETGRLLRASGLDFVVIDMEHQLYDFNPVRDVVLGLHEQPFAPAALDEAISRGIVTPARPPTVLVKIARRGADGIRFDVRHALKMGAMGVFVPFTESGADVAVAVEAATRSESRYIFRVPGEDRTQRDGPWPLHPEGEFLVGAMIESLEGEAHIDEILDTPGLGMVWLAHPSSDEVAMAILRKSEAREIPVASPHIDPESFEADVEAGYRIFFFGWDRDLFNRGLRDVMEAIGR
jgi:2-keto-3-deoxy-L-rhamnonate aldolase RhmA